MVAVWTGARAREVSQTRSASGKDSHAQYFAVGDAEYFAHNGCATAREHTDGTNRTDSAARHRTESHEHLCPAAQGIGSPA
jgi:hypothetical protein